VGGGSSKFWEVRLDGKTVVVRFGRIGTAGQVQQKVFADAPTALRTAERLVREKLAKGYLEARPPGRPPTPGSGDAP
jgi:predicted DNA-binding WGR domain protein